MCHRLLFRPGTCNGGITFAVYLAASPYLRNERNLLNYTKREGVLYNSTSNFYLVPSRYSLMLHYYTQFLIDLFILIGRFLFYSRLYTTNTSLYKRLTRVRRITSKYALYLRQETRLESSSSRSDKSERAQLDSPLSVLIKTVCTYFT
jgi:hypothetical protein